MAKMTLKLLKTILHFENWPMRVREWLHCAPRGRLKLRLRNGPTFVVRAYSSDSAIVQSITREHEYFRYFNVMPGDTVVDIGANIGSFAVSVAFREPSSRVIAVEPLEENFSLLQQNIEANRLQNVTAIRAGIADRAGRQTFYHGKESLHASGSLYEIDAVDARRQETAPCLTLADLFEAQRIGRCDFLKMDCEGAEYQILFGCSDAVWEKIDKLAVEYHNFAPGKNQHDLVALLAGKGYRAVLPEKYRTKEIGLIFAVKEHRSTPRL